MAIATDAFLFSWDRMELHAFPSISGYQASLQTLVFTGMLVILIAPFWPSQEWFPNLLQVAVDTPRLLPMCPDLLWHFHHFYNGLHMLQLTVWKLSSDSFALRSTLRELRRSWRDLSGIQQL